jgi:hypothetical protein
VVIFTREGRETLHLDCEGSRRPSPSQGCKEVVHDRRGENDL